MMMKVHTDRIEISFTKDDTWKTVDLSSLVSNSAVGVFLEELNTCTDCNNDVMGQSTDDSIYANQTDKLNIQTYGTHFVGFPSDSQNVRLRGFDSTSKVYIRAEVYEPDFVFRSRADTASLLHSFSDGEANTWVDKTVTPLGSDEVGDIGAVIITRSAPSNTTSWGVREKGSTDAEQVMEVAFGSAGTDIVGVDGDGKYQLYAGAKDDNPDVFYAVYYEIGYILKSKLTTITNPADEGISTTGGSYEDIDFSSTIPSGAGFALIRWRNTGGLTRLGHTRPNGSTDTAASMALSVRARSNNLVSLDDLRHAEYTVDNLSAQLWITGYIEREAFSSRIKGNKLIIKGNKLLMK